MTQKIMTLHPEESKSGVNIDREKYEVIRRAILETLIANGGEMSFKELTEQIQRNLEASFDGSITWYVVSVKLDMEARGIIERVPKSRPQRIRLVSQ